MSSLDHEIAQIELIMRQWFPGDVFLKASKISSYSLLEEEQQLIDGAILKRKQEFSTGRWLARQGLEQFGLPELPITTGRLRNPVWPEPLLGSITHDGECCAVVLMEKDQHNELGVGIDLVNLSQRKNQLQGLNEMISKHEQELYAVSQLNLAVDPLLLLFSIKESLIKALSFFLTDFIDMRSIQIDDINTLKFRLDSHPITAEVNAALCQNNLLTAARVYQIEA